MPKLTADDKKAYLDHRLVAPGGKCPESDDDDEEEEEDDVETAAASPVQPIAWHCLPNKVFVNLLKGFGVKHYIDLTPSPCCVAADLIPLGISYFGFCATEV